MVDKNSVRAFFDKLAPDWESGIKRSEDVIGRILDEAGVKRGADILDVGCGTGVLIPDYLARGAASVTAIDLSPGMTGIARRKFAEDKRVTILTGDAENTDYRKSFDCIVVYNALPHFVDPAHLISSLAPYLKTGGRLTVAHGMSREALIAHHKGVPEDVSEILPTAGELAEIFARELKVREKREDEKMYLVVGEKE